MTRRIAIVTGAAGGLGLATTRVLIEDGYDVVMVDLGGDKLDRAAAEFGGRATPAPCDISDSAQVEHVAREAGEVAVLVNNAGILSNNKAAETSDAEWRRVLAVNLDGAFYFSRAVLLGMKARRWGRIVNTCSFAQKSGGLTAGTAYTVSKGGLGALTFSLARETAAYGITVNAIAPAHIRTAMVTEQLTEEQRQALLQQILVGRFCESEEFAHAVRFFVSPLAGFVTGEILDMNGGLMFD